MRKHVAISPFKKGMSDNSPQASHELFRLFAFPTSWPGCACKYTSSGRELGADRSASKEVLHGVDHGMVLWHCLAGGLHE